MLQQIIIHEVIPNRSLFYCISGTWCPLDEILSIESEYGLGLRIGVLIKWIFFSSFIYSFILISAESVPMNSPPPLPLPNIISAKSKSSSTQSLMSPRPALNNESQFVSRPPSSCDSGSSNESDVNIQPWYFNIERRQAESCLNPCNWKFYILTPWNSLIIN